MSAPLLDETLPDEVEALQSIYDSDAAGLLSGVTLSAPVHDSVSLDWRLKIVVRPTIEGFVVLGVDIASALAAEQRETGSRKGEHDERAAPVLRRNESAQGQEDDAGSSAPRLRLLLVKHLAPLAVAVTLPSGYPNDVPPTATVVAPWLSASAAAGMSAMLRQQWEEGGRGPALYTFCEWLRLESVPWLLAGGGDAAAAAQWTIPLASLSTATAHVVRSPGSSSQYRHEYAAAIAELLGQLKRADTAVKPLSSATSTAPGVVVTPAKDAGAGSAAGKALRIGGAFWLPSEDAVEAHSPRATPTDPHAHAKIAGGAGASASTGGFEPSAATWTGGSKSLSPLSLTGLASVLERLLEHDEAACIDEWAASDVDCPLCLATLKGARCIRLSACGHAFCVPCLQRHVAIRLRFDAAAASSSAAAPSSGSAGSSATAAGAASAAASSSNGAMFVERFRAAEACPDPSCPGKLALPEMRAACLHGTTAATVLPPSAGAPPPAPAGQLLLRALDQCVAAADEHVAQLALAGVADGDSVVPCPRHKCGRPAILQETR